MDRVTARLFKQIFHEAQVIDFDLSQWDRRLRLVTVAIGLEEAHHRRAIYAVDFVGFKELHWRSTHLAVKLESPEHHCQWVVMDYRIEKDRDFEKITIVGPGSPCPDLVVVCRDVVIQEFDAKLLNAINPPWNRRPYAPLARPGLEELYELRKNRPAEADKKRAAPKRTNR